MKVVVELSGGADSALAAIYAIRKYMEADFYALFIDYEQPYALYEKEASLNIGVHLNRYYGSWSWKRIHVTKFWDDAISFPEYVPLRNLVLSSISLSYAQSIGAEVLVTGSKSLEVNIQDPYSFKDSARSFYSKLEELVYSATENGIKPVRIEPLLAMGRDVKMTKTQVYKELEALGMPATWSCYHPTLNGDECGSCKNCREKAEYVNVNSTN